MAKGPDILLVDDDERLRNAATRVLTSAGHRVQSAATGREALALAQEHPFALVISDLRLPDVDGVALLKELRTLHPDTEVVMITGQGSVTEAVAAMKLGAYDFIEKPLDAASLLKVIAKALEKQQLTSENRSLRRQLQQRRSAEALVGDTPPILAARQLIRQIAPTDVHVLIQGESGTGKEIAADALHHLSERAHKPFIKISCAAIPEALLESELFGHERGAFTGATATKPGKFELADGGTLFLDEIAEMTPPLQAKLLRVLQDGCFQRVGGTRDLRVNLRLLTATHADIPQAIEAGTFRHDLYYRINTVQILLPPLRERRGDVPLLARHFLERFQTTSGEPPHTITPDAMAQLLAHSWPGNVRELEHVIQRALAVTSGDTIRHFTFAPAAPVGPAVGAPDVRIPLGSSLDAATRHLVHATISHCAGNKLKAARMLGIPPRTMYRHYSEAAE